jgi:hypothetical protein
VSGAVESLADLAYVQRLGDRFVEVGVVGAYWLDANAHSMAVVIIVAVLEDGLLTDYSGEEQEESDENQVLKVWLRQKK